jgi:hypothetical protein
MSQNFNVLTTFLLIKDVWKQYFEQLVNDEFDWNRNGLDIQYSVVGPTKEISFSEVKAAITKMKDNKAADKFLRTSSRDAECSC